MMGREKRDRLTGMGDGDGERRGNKEIIVLVSKVELRTEKCGAVNGHSSRGLFKYSHLQLLPM